MNYELVETELVERVNAQIEANSVTALYEASVQPENEAAAKIVINKSMDKAVALCEFSASMPQPSGSVGSTTQEEIVRFRWTFQATKLRGAGGLHALMSLVKLCLIGYKPANAMTRLTYSGYGLLEFEQNKFQPYLEFECKAVNQQAFNDNTNDVPYGTEPIKVIFPPDVTG
jgi:hypothetical protein